FRSGAIGVKSGATCIRRRSVGISSGAISLGLRLGNRIAGVATLGVEPRLSAPFDGEASGVFSQAHHVTSLPAVSLRILALVVLFARLRPVLFQNLELDLCFT